METKISIIDDHQNLLYTLSISLKLYGYQVVTFSCPEKALKYHLNNSSDFYLIDMSMPKMNGIEFYQKLCMQFDKNSLPAIFLTAVEEWESKCLKKTTISDYVKKPFNTEGLIARIERILSKKIPDLNKNRIQVGNLQLDEDKMKCLWFNKNIILTRKEYRLVKFLAQNPERIFSREQLLNFCYPNNLNVTDRVIDSQIKRIRKKFRESHPDNKKFDRIHTKYGVGYVWIPSNSSIQ